MTAEDKKLAGILLIELEKTIYDSIEETAKEVKKKYGVEVDVEALKADAHNWAIDRANESAQSINATTKELLQSQQEQIEALKDEANIQAKEKEIESEIADMISARAEEIAITETTSALSVGNMMVWMSAGIETVSWITENDDAVCSICEDNEADGEIDIGEVFSSGDTEPPAHPSCRCYLVESI